MVHTGVQITGRSYEVFDWKCWIILVHVVENVVPLHFMFSMLMYNQNWPHIYNNISFQSPQHPNLREVMVQCQHQSKYNCVM